MRVETFALCTLIFLACTWNPSKAQRVKCAGALDLSCDKNESSSCGINPAVHSCEECCIRPDAAFGGECYKTNPIFGDYCDANFVACAIVSNPSNPFVYCLAGVNGHDNLCYNQFTQSCLGGRVCDGVDAQYCSPVPPNGPGGCYRQTTQVCLGGIICDGIDAALCRANGQFAEGSCYNTKNQTCNYVGQDLKPVVCDGFNSSYCPPDPNNPDKFPGKCFDHTTQTCDNGHICEGTGMRLCTEHTTPYIGECYNTSTHICLGRKVCSLNERLCERGVNGGVDPGICINDTMVCIQGAVCSVGLHYCAGIAGEAGECFNPRTQGCFNGSTCFLGLDCFIDQKPTASPTSSPQASALPSPPTIPSVPTTTPTTSSPTSMAPISQDEGSSTDYRLIFIIFCAVLLVFICAAIIGIIVKCSWNHHLKTKRGKPIVATSVEIGPMGQRQHHQT